MKWYSNCYRRHLLDMHITDWNPAFLSEFDPEHYVELLKTAQIQSAMLYYQSHVGLCYYPTKTARMHRAFEKQPDMMRRVEELCHENGIRTVGYYSIVFNEWAEIHHPEWAIIDQVTGKALRDTATRHGQCCPNHPDYRTFTRIQIKEMLEYFAPDGMFYDMPFWPHPCSCACCRSRWLAETGKPWPQNPKDPELLAARRRWMADFTQFVAAETRALRPDVAVEFNCAYAALGPESVAISEEVCLSGDYVGGDVYKTFRTQSAVCKFYNALTANAPFEYMTGRCMPDLTSHTITKSRDRLTLAIMLTMAHHGANFIIDAIDPVGTMDDRFYKLLGELFEQSKAYEPSLTGKLLSEVEIYFDQRCKEYPAGLPTNHYNGVLMASETLSRAHIANGIFGRYSLDRIHSAKAVILPEIGMQDDEARRVFIDYVANGGTLYFSGAGDTELLKTLTGGTAVGETEQQRTYMAPHGERGEQLLEGFNAKYPLPINAPQPIVEGIPAEAVVATITLPYLPQEYGQYASIHSNPPGTPTDHPALAILPYGNGTVIWSAAPIECFAVENYRTLLLALLGDRIAPNNRLLQTTAPTRVELVASADEAQGVVHISALDMNEEDVAETRLPFEITLQTDKPVQKVVLLPNKTPVAFTQENGRVRFTTRPLYIHDRYEICFEK